jgi:hypothetical protein
MRADAAAIGSEAEMSEGKTVGNDQLEAWLFLH